MYDDSTHGGGSAVWTSALGAAMGDGIVPRTRTIPTLTAASPGFRWPWSRAPRAIAEQATPESV
jgi:hypothetical protein